MKAALARLRTVRELRRENLAARHGGYRQDAIVEGTSQAWRTVKTQIAQVAPSQAPVLIQGETGSGKDVVARLLHAHSRRAGGPFIAVNCGAVSRELLESELFGYEKGAFTGAAQAKPGLIAAAEGGSCGRGGARAARTRRSPARSCAAGLGQYPLTTAYRPVVCTTARFARPSW